MLRCIQYEDKFDIEMKFVILPEGKDPDDIIKESAQTWHKLLTEALPVVDYTVNIDRNEAVSKLIPIIALMEDNLRRDRYLTQLQKLTGIRYEQLESAAKAFRVRQTTRRPRAEAVAHAVKTLVSSPLEENCLALLLQHPELKSQPVDILPEYFENSANREIFSTWSRQVGSDPAAIREGLDTALQEYYDTLLAVNKPILATKIEERYNDYVLSLKREYLRNLERKREAIFALEAELKGSGADRKKLEEEGIEPSAGLREVFTQKATKGRRSGEKN
jgi:DNA primase